MLQGSHVCSAFPALVGTDRLSRSVPAFRGPRHQESLSDVGGIEASDSATALLRSIVQACIETIVPHSPLTTSVHPLCPSMGLVTHLDMRFSGFHMDTKWHSDEIMRLQHYNLLVDASCKLPPKLEAFMLDLETALQPPPWAGV